MTFRYHARLSSEEVRVSTLIPNMPRSADYRVSAAGRRRQIAKSVALRAAIARHRGAGESNDSGFAPATTERRTDDSTGR